MAIKLLVSGFENKKENLEKGNSYPDKKYTKEV